MGLREVRGFAARFAAAAAGNLAVTAALALPVVGLAAVGGIQIAYVVTVRSKTQDIADSAALMAAQQLQVAPAGATARAQSWANAQLASLPANTTSQVQVTMLASSQVQVTIHSNTPSFFGPDLPVGGFNTLVSSVAQALGSAPLCVFNIGTTSAADLNLQGSAALTSTCLVYSDSDVTVASGASLTAPQTEAVTTATGPITVAPFTNATPVGDPFLAQHIAAPLSCPSKFSQIDVTSNTTFPPLIPICADVVVHPNVTLTLGSSGLFGGEHYIGYNLTLMPGSQLKGTNVVIFFGPNATLTFQPNSVINLSGRQTGTYAGFVMITDKAQTTPFVIPSDPFQSVTGTIYSPTAPLAINGTAQAAQASDWTVIVANGISLQNSPKVQVNSNYSSSPVPVPSGVGPSAGSGSRLVS